MEPEGKKSKSLLNSHTADEKRPEEVEESEKSDVNKERGKHHDTVDSSLVIQSDLGACFLNTFRVSRIKCKRVIYYPDSCHSIFFIRRSRGKSGF